MFVFGIYIIVYYRTVCRATGVFGANVTSAVVPEQAHEPDHAQTLLLHMVVTIVRARHKKHRRVC